MSTKLEMPAIPEEFIVRLKHAGNKEFIKAEGLIYLGHLQGLKRIDVQVIQFPSPEMPGTCYARCEVETGKGVFTDYGEVTPANKGTVGGQYPVSLACTRARNRALRQATNCPLTSYEEMGMSPSDKNEPDADAEDSSPQPQRQQPQRQGPQAPQRQQASPTPMHPSTGVVVGALRPTTPKEIITGVVTTGATDDPPPPANKRFYTDPATGEMVPAPTPVAQRLYAALRQQAEAESMNTIDPANLLTAEDMNGATNNLVAELAARIVDDAGSPTAEELKDLGDLFRAYDGAGVKLITPEKRTAGVVWWLIATLTAVRNDVKKRAKAPEAAVA